MNDASGPLVGIRVLDLATIFAAPFTAMLLGDYGADVIKVEHPRGDPMRSHGHTKNGHGLWWKMVARNKRAITLDLSLEEGQEILLKLAARADVLIENFRPGVMERWHLGHSQLAAGNPGLVMLRTTGFGQYGPYSARPGFGTLAESMSGFAAITGEPEGPPTLPPFGLADGIAGLAGAFAVMNALYSRDARGGSGQVIDLAIIEPILSVLGNQPTVFDQLGIIQGRTGNRSANNAPRNTYRTRDGRWIALSTSVSAIAARVMTLVGHPEVVEQPWFGSAHERARRGDDLDRWVAEWVAARDYDEAMRLFEQAGAAVAPIYNVRDAMDDAQYRALGSFTTLEDEDLGPLVMQNLLFRMTGTPGRVRFPGRRLGQDNQAVYAELGLDADDLRSRGVV